VEVKKFLNYFSALCIFKELTQDPVIQALKALLKAIERKEKSPKIMAFYNEYAYQLLEKDPYFSITHYMTTKMLYEETPFTKRVETGSAEEFLPTVAFELELLYEMSQIEARQIKDFMLSHTEDTTLKQMIEKLMEWDKKKVIEPFKEENFKNAAKDLLVFYKERGTGYFARYYAFTWDRQNGLQGVENPDPITLDDLAAYESQKQEVIQNTEMFLKGYGGNNLLLYGARGTGKSSLVKAIVNAYHTKGIKLIEVSKENLVSFDKLIQLLQNKKQKFILFVDDLAFEDSEDSYTALKTILEGGICAKPSNLIIYATSNRRHLVKEKLSDRAGILNGGSDEVHAKDVMEEKLSLADRFGKTISFSSPNQNQYLEIVRKLAKAKQIDLDEELLERKAIQWEMLNNGRSGRSAKQFILDLEGSLKLEGSSAFSK